jgi:hypothetical protein
MITYGYSTGCAPNQPNKITSATNNQKKNWESLSNFELVIINFCIIGKINNIAIASPMHATPPSLLGIERKIA